MTGWAFQQTGELAFSLTEEVFLVQVSESWFSTEPTHLAGILQKFSIWKKNLASKALSCSFWFEHEYGRVFLTLEFFHCEDYTLRKVGGSSHLFYYAFGKLSEFLHLRKLKFWKFLLAECFWGVLLGLFKVGPQ